MVQLSLQDEKTKEFITSWKNFNSHVHGVFDASSYSQLAEYKKSKVWQRVRDQELAKWKATLVSHHRNPPFSMRDQKFLEFPDQESLMAFELAWS